jgi:hypothetical protein
MKNRSWKMIAAAAMLAALTIWSCDKYPAEQEPAPAGALLRVRVQSGDGQTERVGAPLAHRVVVRVSDILNNPQTGAQVSFRTSAAGAAIAPAQATTDANGLASFALTLGSTPGAQQVLAFTKNDTTTIVETAVAIGCQDESLSRLCRWPAAHIFIATTSSSLLSGAGSAILDYDPVAKTVSKVLETSETINGLSFSSRGELFATSFNGIYKVNPSTKQLDDYVPYVSTLHISLEPNQGGILAGLCEEGPLKVRCAPQLFQILLPPHIFPNIQWENVAVDPVTRSVFLIDQFGTLNFKIWKVLWDGRSAVQTFGLHADLNVGAAAPRGMCADSSGTLYTVFDGNDNYRRIVSVAADGAIDYNFFDFYSFAGGNNETAGRWGDIAYLQGKLYVIDRRNDRLVIISHNGHWLDEIKNTAFSRPLSESETYAIAASPTWMCVDAR